MLHQLVSSKSQGYPRAFYVRLLKFPKSAHTQFANGNIPPKLHHRPLILGLAMECHEKDVLILEMIM